MFKCKPVASTTTMIVNSSLNSLLGEVNQSPLDDSEKEEQQKALSRTTSAAFNDKI